MIPKIFYTEFSEPLPALQWEEYLHKLPVFLQERTQRFTRWQDRHAFLYGKLLLMEGLNEIGLSDGAIHNLQYTKYDKPVLNENLDFSISHSGDYVLCAITDEGKIGIDIELIRQVNISEFRDVFDETEWDAITCNKEMDEQIKKFFHFWTRKESLIKADGRGLSLDLKKISWQDGQACVDDNLWYYCLIKGFDGYCCHLTSSDRIKETKLKKVAFNDK